MLLPPQVCPDGQSVATLHPQLAPEMQAWPLLFLNSPRSSYVAGEALHVDGGFLASMVTGQLDVQLPEGFE